MTPFYPVFQTDVIGTAPNGQTYQLSQYYCLSEDSAKQLQALLSDLNPTIVDGPPAPNLMGVYKFNKLVPLFTFPDGKVRNAGVLATYWVWFGGSQAMQAARADIADPYMGTELL